MPIPLESSFEKLLVLLVKSDVRFITVGDIAVCLNGYVRLTEDVDILIDPVPPAMTAYPIRDSAAGQG